MTRIIAGRLGGRRLSVPPGLDTRPTSDRVREALFSTLEATIGLSGARVADLYAGSGALGLEALSRGAAHVLLVEADSRAARVARANVEALKAGPDVIVLTQRVERVLASAPDEPYDVVVADPPYALPAVQVGEMLTALVANRWLAEEAMVVVERSTRGAPFEWVPGLAGADQRRYGETMVWYGRRS